MRPQLDTKLTLMRDGTVFATGPIDLSPEDQRAVIWVRLIQYQKDGVPLGPIEAASQAAADAAIQARAEGKDEAAVMSAAKDAGKGAAAPRSLNAVSGWGIKEMNADRIVAALDAASSRLASELPKRLQSMPGPRDEFTARIDLGPKWEVVKVKPPEGERFEEGEAQAEAWLWVEREDKDGDTYQFSIYWNDEVDLEPEGQSTSN